MSTGTAACKDNGLDWYNNLVGETPCRTYERLRQLCNDNYKVGVLSTSLPGDTCNDSPSDCCCNSVAFSLSMLCVSCQQGGTGIGHDAPKGTYQNYLNPGNKGTCSPKLDHSLPSGVQDAVNNSGIKILDAFYNRVFWSDGSWFYAWTRDFISTQDRAFFSISTTSAPPSTTSTTPTSTTSPTSTTPTTPTTPASPDTSSTSSSNPTTSSSEKSQSSSSTSHEYTTVIGSATITIHDSAPPTSPTSQADTVPTLANSAQTTTQRQGMGAGNIAGLVVGVVLAIAAVIAVVWFIRRRRNRRIVLEDERSISTFHALAGDPDRMPPPEKTESRAPPSSTGGSESASMPTSARHTDAGPISPGGLDRRVSGRLPPAYDELRPLAPLRPVR